MSKIILSLLLVVVPVFGQTPAQTEAIRKDAAQLQSDVNDVVSAGVPGIAVLQSPKAAYLEGYGLIVTLEVALERPRNPFSSQRTPAELRAVVTERRKQMQDKLTDFLKRRLPVLQSLGSTDAVAVIVHFMNTNPADVPDMPSQLTLSMRKQDAVAGRIQVREF